MPHKLCAQIKAGRLLCASRLESAWIHAGSVANKERTNLISFPKGSSGSLSIHRMNLTPRITQFVIRTLYRVCMPFGDVSFGFRLNFSHLNPRFNAHWLNYQRAPNLFAQSLQFELNSYDHKLLFSAFSNRPGMSFRLVWQLPNNHRLAINFSVFLFCWKFAKKTNLLTCYRKCWKRSIFNKEQ